MYRYKNVEINNIKDINDLGANGWRAISSTGGYVLMEQEYYVVASKNLMPVQRTIGDPNALYKCQNKVKRYEWSCHMEYTEFLTIDEFKNNEFYTDEGEYEAYLSDGFYFIGTDISRMGSDEFDDFVKNNKDKFKDQNNLKIYYIDYPEDK